MTWAHRKTKYGNTPVAGFHSKKEAKRAWELQALEKAELIKDLQFQVPFELGLSLKGRMLKYVADFVYTTDSSAKVIVEDTKGYMTETAKVKLAWFLQRYGATHELRIT